MKLVDVAFELSKLGFYFHEEKEFGDYEDVTFQRGRIVFAEPDAGVDGKVIPCGISFWLHQGVYFNILGLWSGNKYFLPEQADIKTLVLEMLTGVYFRKGNAPWALPPEALDKYKMRKIKIITLLPASNADYYAAAIRNQSRFLLTQADFVRLIEPLVTSCQVDANGFVTIQLETATALTRFHKNGSAGNRLLVVFLDSMRDTLDQITLLHALSKGLNCSMYDPGWGENRIRLEDPYYGDPAFTRPEEPINAWASLRE